ncbi:MAG: translation initiation factor IF-2, partial [Armatimonadetes bacterium]|nr:translation initiation factor IF-2 [Armatimonadota bacterium]
TTLLDAIRRTDVVSQEFGGITQHIGAYQTEISTQDGSKRITFIDTPGHAAFTQMRARGAQVTDMVILVVAADDGVMPQTIEAINHARAAKVPIIVAVNKVDKEDANVERTKQQLMEHALVPEEWGGETIVVEISAKEKLGIDDLLEMITLVAEMEELRADPGAAVQGTIVEAKLEKGRGPVATVLVQDGTLKTNDTVVVNTTWGRIRAMTDDRGRKVAKAGPASPVEVIGLDAVPMAGDRIEVVKDEREARDLVAGRVEALREQRAGETRGRISLQDLFKQMAAGEVKEFNIILKADVQGSVEVLRESLEKVTVTDEEVKLAVLHAGVGNIGESDIMLANASNAVVIGFNVRLDPKARRMAEDDRIDVRTYNVIYELLDDVQAAMTGMLEPVYEERVLGLAEVRATFRSPRGAIAGCMVTDGRVQRGSEVRVLRNKEEVFRGRLSSLRHIKEDVREMAAGFECGIMLDGFNDFKEGDIIQSFLIEEVHRA